MNIHTLRRRQLIPHPRSHVFGYFEAPGNLARITPPWLGFRILTPSPIIMKVGTVLDYTIRWLGFPVRWRTLITTYDPPFRFVDEQIKGPYSLWHHLHSFEETEDGTEMTDEVHYCLPFGFLGDLAHRLIVRRQLDHIFDYRALVIEGLLHGEERAVISGRQVQVR